MWRDGEIPCGKEQVATSRPSAWPCMAVIMTVQGVSPLYSNAAGQTPAAHKEAV